MRRRDVVKLLGVGALAASAPRAWAQGREVVIGVLYPLSGPVAQAGVDAKAAAETAAEIVNTRQDLELPLARTEGLPGLGGARLRLIFVDHQGKPELGQSEAERLITQEKAVALYGAYHSSVSATASVVGERLGVPYLSGESSSPTLHRRGFKWFFRTSPHDEHFSIAMFEFLKELQAKRGSEDRHGRHPPRGHALRRGLGEGPGAARPGRRVQGGREDRLPRAHAPACRPRCSGSRPRIPTSCCRPPTPPTRSCSSRPRASSTTTRR